MAIARPQVTVFNALNGSESSGTVVMPHVMMAPLRPDLVRFVHTNQSKNFHEPQGTFKYAGYETSAESWGTGRAVSRIPRVAGGGTHRAGQGAFGNMCRGGGMFSPKKIWRKIHRKINLTKRRHALASAIAATAIPGLVMARGHRVDEVRELPIVVSDDLQRFIKTKAANELLKQLGCGEDVDKARESKKVRAGKGKLRNRRHVCRRGPLIIYSKSRGCHQAFKALLGVDLLSVDSMNILKLAPGGTLGRLVVWTESAFKKLDVLFGDYTRGSSKYKSYTLPRSVMTNADLSRVINSAEIQSVLKPLKEKPTKPTRALNPLNNKTIMNRLNPAAPTLRKRKSLEQTPGTAAHTALKEKRDAIKDEVRQVKKLKKQQRQKEEVENCAIQRDDAGEEADE